MLSMEFRMAMVVTKKILSMLQPADAALQARSAGLKDAITIVKCVQDEITNLRSDEMYHTIFEEAKSMTSSNSEPQRMQVNKSNRMNDYLIHGPSCSFTRQNKEGQYPDAPPFKSEYFETLDTLNAELRRRFSDNEDLLNSLASLDELDVDKMEPLKALGKWEKTQ